MEPPPPPACARAGTLRSHATEGPAIDAHETNPNDPDLGDLVPIVVGAHVLAELGDRPPAYRLRDLLADLLPGSLTPVVVTDVWYLNSDWLRTRPTISLGAPARNALTAHLADRVPSAFVADDRFMVQLDVELADLTACCWGVDDGATAMAVDLFVEKYAFTWARAVAERERVA